MLLTSTESAVVVVFHNISDAETAAGELTRNAFAEDHIYISSENTPSSRGTGHHENGVRNWFESIFGKDDQTERQYYERAIAAGNVLLGLETPEQNVGAATQILRHHAPLDVRWYGAKAPTVLRGLQVYSLAVEKSVEARGAYQKGQREVPSFGSTHSVTLCHWQPYLGW